MAAAGAASREQLSCGTDGATAVLALPASSYLRGWGSPGSGGTMSICPIDQQCQLWGAWPGSQAHACRRWQALVRVLVLGSPGHRQSLSSPLAPDQSLPAPGSPRSSSALFQGPQERLCPALVLQPVLSHPPQTRANSPAAELATAPLAWASQPLQAPQRQPATGP